MRGKWNLRKEDHQNWIVFGGSVFISFVLSILVILLDTRMIPLLDHVPEWLLTNVTIAIEVLSALVGTLFAVTTFTFSAMLTVVSLYSSNFSPRLIENFLLNKVALRTLGIFLGGFVYSLSSLVFMRELPDDAMVVSATVVWIYAIAAVIYFIRFIFQTSNFVQQEKLVSKTYRDAKEVFDKNSAFFKDAPKLSRLPEFDTRYQYTIKADTNAYVDYIHFEELNKICEKYQAVCLTHVRIGAFLSQNQPVAVLYTNQRMKDEEYLNRQVNETIAYHTERSAISDPYYSRNKLNDIALRAISPAINDPNTAIHVLHYKSLLEAELAKQAGKYAVLGDPSDNGSDVFEEYRGCIFYEYNNFPADLQEGYWQLVHYMKEDLTCISAIFDGLLVIANAAHEENVPHIKEYSHYVYEKTQEYFPLQLDRKLIEEKHQAILDR
ncbi:DUF2254 domain-containing protein [Jeotgalibaca caeni]|uniref:DUF2254 domain-containing protein n=1 Tax=Jeotgalibaca caeni TaxID=3028623 RepID=UPI00237D390E|nr:DUF2254 family protein [Jeotgalibaca caeni]MDE1549826.1 DUF2254 domain-containing protein [Jeotgalibaca caeni]